MKPLSTGKLSASELEAANEIKTFLMNHVRENISIQQLINKMPTSRHFIEKKFPLVFGKTVHKFLLEYRMLLAVTFLKKDQSVKAISLECGYKNPASFSKAFKLFHGISPAKFQNRKT